MHANCISNSPILLGLAYLRVKINVVIMNFLEGVSCQIQNRHLIIIHIHQKTVHNDSGVVTVTFNKLK